LDNFDELIANALPKGDLSGVIGNTQYQQGSPDQLPQGVNLTGVGDPNAPQDIGQYGGNVQPNQQIGVNPGVTPGQPAFVPQSFVPQQPAGQQDTAALQAERQRLEQVAYQANLARIEAEDAKFMAEIAHLSDDDKERAVLQRELGQTREVNTWLNQRVQGMQKQQGETEQRYQQRAKNYWVLHVAAQSGLPIENPAIKNALSGANNPQEMRAIAENLVGLINRNTAQTSQQVVNSGIFAAGGGTTGPATTAMPKQRSGDIAGLISSRGQVAVNIGQ
jgi:hypothetical protein